MSRYVAVVLFLSFGAVFHLSYGIEVNVTDQGKLCLYANLKLNFSVSYDVAVNKSKTVSFELPADATSSESNCRVNSSLLKLDFGDGHSWSLMFSSDGKSYQPNVIFFSYNLSDSKLFPDASQNVTLTVTTKVNIKDVALDTCYSCKSEDLIQVNSQVNMTLWNVLLQAFVKNGSKSENLTSCAADQPTPAPTTAAPVTNTTTPTAAPVTNATTTAAPVTTTPTPTLPPPIVGNYSVNSSQNTTACLLASFGLQIRFKQNEKFQEMNFDPTNVGVSGACGTNSSELVLTSTHVNITFSFLSNTKKFFLHALKISVSTSSGVFEDSSSNLTLWETSVGSSYMCNKELNNTITNQLSLYTTNLHVQPFGVKNGVYSTAHECSMDDPSILIPIIVGAALAGLILIVVIAYIIGRRKTYAGYQTL